MFTDASAQTVKSIQDNFHKNVITTQCHEEKNFLQEPFVSTKLKQISIQNDPDNDDIARRMNPRSEKDIKLLYSELKLWRTHQFEQIEQMHGISVEERIKLRSNALLKETFLLRKIEELGKVIRSETDQMELESKLDKCTNPSQWSLSNGEVIEVVSACKERSSELAILYQKYSNNKTAHTGKLYIFCKV